MPVTSQSQRHHGGMSWSCFHAKVFAYSCLNVNVNLINFTISFGAIYKCYMNNIISQNSFANLYQAQVPSCMEHCRISVERKAKRLCKLELATILPWSRRFYCLDHRRTVTCLTVFYKEHFLECAQELYNLIPLSPFLFRTITKSGTLHPYVWLTTLSHQALCFILLDAYGTGMEYTASICVSQKL